MRTPTVHLNGTSADSLRRDYMTALEALTAAERAIQDAYPNGRDYYVQKGNAIAEAQDEHNARLRKLNEIKAEIYEIIEAIDNQQRS